MTDLPNAPALAADSASADLLLLQKALAAQKDEYLRLIREAGFTDVQVVEERAYTVGAEALAPGSPERGAFESVVSVKVRAVKKA